MTRHATKIVQAMVTAASAWPSRQHRTMREVIELEGLKKRARVRALTRPLDIARLRHLRERERRGRLICGMVE